MITGGLSGKVVAISGASRGLGRALAERFSSEGATLALISKTPGGLDAVELRTDGEHFLFDGDITDVGTVAKFSKEALGRFGHVDVLINNASILGSRKSINDYPIDVWREVLKVNLEGTLGLTKAFLPSMLERESGSIINISSSVGRAGRADWGAYAVSKFGVEGLTQVLADEVRDQGVRVNSVNPGGMATEMRQAAFPHEDPKTLPQPSENLDVYLYLAGNQSIGITGRAFDARNFST